MGEQKQNIIYSAENIQKYLSGELSPLQMHEMEKAALEDEFLAEAIEGYAAMQERDWKKQLALIKDNFSKKDKIIPVHFPAYKIIWKAVAAILIIGSGVAITYTLISRKNADKNTTADIQLNPDSLHSALNSSTTADAVTDTISIGSYKNNTDTGSRQSIPLVKDNTRTYAIRERENKITIDTVTRSLDNKEISKPDLADANAAASPAEDNKMKPEVRRENAPETMKEQAAGKKKGGPFDKNNELLFIGQVVGLNNTPLPFANIQIPAKNSQTYSNANGYFKLLSPDSTLNVSIKSAGFVSGNYTLRNDLTQNKIVLLEDKTAANREIIVTGYGTRLKSYPLFESDSLTNAEPEDGWDNYKIYIANNIFLSNENVQKNIHGEVEASFTLDLNGGISNLKIDKSLCSDCDKEVLRIIKEGPPWKVKNGKKAVARVKVNF